MRRTTSPDPESSAEQGTIHHQKALGTKVLSSQTQETESTQEPHAARGGTISDETLFTGENGQALLLAFSSSSNVEGNAVLIPVYRPSKKWAHKMVELEKASSPVSGAAPKKSEFEVERWKRIRWERSGESETAIWNRIRSQFEAQMPFYSRKITAEANLTFSDFGIPHFMTGVAAKVLR
ncbi:hypothetical protein PRZ48_012773 [Zasmidium cellare]|uniref:Uncharacterized protein n=1 Tax=Zasmidium cellare TaxID=395010 RepID=A0ABR0E5T3_ZASCE|nr:hypothetical protein PRZ48_012773 [Zasmidium cellare]